MNKFDTKSFASQFKDIAYYHHRYKVFQDFVALSAIAIHNKQIFDQSLENTYLTIIKGYEKGDVSKISSLLGQLILSIQSEPHDFLGKVFMEMELGNSHAGQFFTPPDIQRLLTRMVCSDIEDRLKDQPYISVQEPACGSGGMVIELAELMIEKGLNPRTQLFASCVDIDSTAAYMAYLQLSALNIPAEVNFGNTLTMEINRTMYTPALFAYNWKKRLTKGEEAQRDAAPCS